MQAFISQQRLFEHAVLPLGSYGYVVGEVVEGRAPPLPILVTKQPTNSLCPNVDSQSVPVLYTSAVYNDDIKAVRLVSLVTCADEVNFCDGKGSN